MSELCPYAAGLRAFAGTSRVKVSLPPWCDSRLLSPASLQHQILMVAKDAVLNALLFFICCCASKREGKSKLLTPSKKHFFVLLSLLVAA